MKKDVFSFSVLSGFAVLLTAQFFFVLAYVHREHTFYFWDYAMYMDMAKQWFSLARSPVFWPVFWQRFSESYNLLFALPSFLGFALKGVSREVFIASNFIGFALAHQIGIGCVLARVFSFRWPLALFSSAILASLIPPFWVPLLQGYPDNSAAACLSFALFFALSEKRSWKNAFPLGLLLGFAIIFRRHYAYPAIALLLTLGLFDFWALCRTRLFAAFFRASGLFYGVVFLSLFGSLFVFEPSYVQTMLKTDFLSLYQSYARGFFFFLAFLVSRAGLLLLAATVLGFGVLLKTASPSKDKAFFVLCFFLVWLFLWGLGPSQAGDHYLLAVLPLFCAVGLAALGDVLLKKGRLFLLSGLGLLALLGANSAYALWFAPRFPLPTEKPAASFFSWARPPWVRPDYDELVRLASFLGETAKQGDHIAVVASSFVLNQDLLRAVYVDALRQPSLLHPFLFVSDVDNVQPPSLDAYAGSTIYVVPHPAQYHLPPDGQKSIKALSSLFPPPEGFSSLFSEDPRRFTLLNDVTVSVWRRKDWTPLSLHQGLAAFRRISNGPIHWVAETRGLGFRQITNNPGASDLNLLFNKENDNARLFYDRPLLPGFYRMSAKISSQPSCQTPTLTTRLRGGDGQSVFMNAVHPFQNPGSFYSFFHVSSETTEPLFLSVDIKTQPVASCFVALRQLMVEEMDARGLPTPLE